MEEKPAEPAPKPVNSFGKLYSLIRERWPEYVLEIAVIIFSITISFAFDEWKDSRHKQELEQAYLKGLYKDVKIDTSQLKEVIAETQQVIHTANSLAELNPQTSRYDYRQFVSQTRFIFKRPRFIAEDATFADLKSTGNIQVINSFPLKNSLFDYYKQYETIVQVETAELETTNTIVGPYLLKRFPLAGKTSSPPIGNWLAITGEIEFQNALLIRRTTREELLHNYQRSLALGNQILALIKPQLK